MIFSNRTGDPSPMTACALTWIAGRIQFNIEDIRRGLYGWPGADRYLHELVKRGYIDRIEKGVYRTTLKTRPDRYNKQSGSIAQNTLLGAIGEDKQ